MSQNYTFQLTAIAFCLAALLWPMFAQLPCPTEDSTNCTWYADIQGNGKGQSFTSFAAFGQELTIWWKQH